MSSEHLDNGGGAGDALIRFDGHWSEYLKIALVNLLLTIVTLGIYRFWAKTRIRQYLWSRTSLMGEPLEYTGTGLQLFLGAIIAFVAVLLPLVIINNIATALIVGGQPVLGGLVMLLLFVGLFYVFGVGLYRTQRYILSHTNWRGIRGGMTGNGWAYGVSFLWRNAVAILSLYLAMPWATTRLWNERWADARFGSLEFRADAPAQPLFKRFVISLVGAVALYGVVIGTNFALVKEFGQMAGQTDPSKISSVLASVFGLIILLSIGISLIMLSYYALFWRHVIGHMALDDLKFRFTASTRDWFLFLLGNVGLIIVTLGLGFIMMPYRIYAFMAGHLEAEGALAPASIEQSRLAMPQQGEGIADAFDLSPI